MMSVTHIAVGSLCTEGWPQRLGPFCNVLSTEPVVSLRYLRAFVAIIDFFGVIAGEQTRCADPMFVLARAKDPQTSHYARASRRCDAATIPRRKRDPETEASLTRRGFPSHAFAPSN